MLHNECEQPFPVWLDCDPGHDDVLAIILAGFHPGLRLLGISTVASNQTVEKVTRNALDVVSFAGLSGIGVVAGAHKPLVRPAPLLCPEIHGESGLDGPQGGPLLPHSGGQPLKGKAVAVMFEALAAAYAAGGGARVGLVCTGALTNAALLLTIYPEVTPMLEVTIMGGCLGVGNTGPVQEFNIQTDPEAARVVFEAGLPRLTMVPLEVTHTALATPDVLELLLGGGGGGAAGPTVSSFRLLVQQLLTFFAGTYRTVFGFEAPPLHDPCAVAAAVAPHLFQMQRMRVDVETCSPLSAGQTVCDVWGQSGRPPNAWVCRSMDVQGFWAVLAAALAVADDASPMGRRGGRAPK